MNVFPDLYSDDMGVVEGDMILLVSKDKQHFAL